jgi:hypothetical protein
MELEELENVEIEVVGFALADQANHYLQSLDKT